MSLGFCPLLSAVVIFSIFSSSVRVLPSSYRFLSDCCSLSARFRTSFAHSSATFSLFDVLLLPATISAYKFNNFFSPLPLHSTAPLLNLQSSDDTLGAGAIAGIVIAGLFLLVIAALVAIAFIFYRNNHFTKLDESVDDRATDIAMAMWNQPNGERDGVSNGNGNGDAFFNGDSDGNGDANDNADIKQASEDTDLKTVNFDKV
jgi:hypothetical protein